MESIFYIPGVAKALVLNPLDLINTLTERTRIPSLKETR